MISLTIEAYLLRNIEQQKTIFHDSIITLRVHGFDHMIIIWPDVKFHSNYGANCRSTEESAIEL